MKYNRCLQVNLEGKQANISIEKIKLKQKKTNEIKYPLIKRWLTNGFDIQAGPIGVSGPDWMRHDEHVI